MSTGEATEPVSDHVAPDAAEPTPERVATAAEQLFGDPTPGDQPMLPAIRKLFRGEEPGLVGVGVASFLGGLCEATLLVLIANLALSIGGDTLVDQQASLFGLGTLPVRTLFMVALALTALRLGLQYVASRL
ncbi:MAG: hypothetical protein ACKO5A_07050, partial [Actinomycetota bacterium]